MSADFRAKFWSKSILSVCSRIPQVGRNWDRGVDLLGWKRFRGAPGWRVAFAHESQRYQLLTGNKFLSLPTIQWHTFDGLGFKTIYVVSKAKLALKRSSTLSGPIPSSSPSISFKYSLAVSIPRPFKQLLLSCFLIHSLNLFLWICIYLTQTNPRGRTHSSSLPLLYQTYPITTTKSFVCLSPPQFPNHDDSTRKGLLGAFQFGPGYPAG